MLYNKNKNIKSLFKPNTVQLFYNNGWSVWGCRVYELALKTFQPTGIREEKRPQNQSFWLNAWFYYTDFRKRVSWVTLGAISSTKPCKINVVNHGMQWGKNSILTFDPTISSININYELLISSLLPSRKTCFEKVSLFKTGWSVC